MLDGGREFHSLKDIYINISKDVETRFGSSKHELDRTDPKEKNI